MQIRFVAIALLAAGLTGCSLNTSCVAINDPNERVLQGIVIGKEHVPGPVVIRPPRAVKVTDQPPEGGSAAVGARILTALVAPHPMAAATPGYAVAQNMANPELHWMETVPANPQAEVGEPCEVEDKVLQDGATRYEVKVGDSRYLAHSAFPGFEAGECVNLFVARRGKSLNVRIARGLSCDVPPVRARP